MMETKVEYQDSGLVKSKEGPEVGPSQYTEMTKKESCFRGKNRA
jgi:hypothetical protein